MMFGVRCFVFGALLLFLDTSQSVDKEPNVCKTFDDYYNMKNNSNCWYNPDVELDTVGFATKHGYPIENYTVTTKDGYILTVYRLPRKDNPRGIIFLQHPAITCSTIWLDKGNLSLGFQLYDEGYDVWLANARGDRFSRKHLYLSPETPEFWDHSFDEMCLYDIPAEVELIKNMTDAEGNMAFIGHSLGGTDAILYPILYPEETSKLFRVMIPAAAGLQLKRVNNRLAPILFANNNLLWNLAKRFNLMEILSPAVTNVYQAFCRDYSAGVEFCANSVNFLLGPSHTYQQMVPEWYPLIFSQHPSGVSVKVFVHYMKNSMAGRFQHFDYGPEENLKRYNSTQPPEYRVEDIRVPIHFVTGDKDPLCTFKDTQDIYERLPEKYRAGHVVLPGFNHLDFMYSRRINIFNRHIIKVLNKTFKKKKITRVNNNYIK